MRNIFDLYFFYFLGGGLAGLINLQTSFAIGVTATALIFFLLEQVRHKDD